MLVWIVSFPLTLRYFQCKISVTIKVTFITSTLSQLTSVQLTFGSLNWGLPQTFSISKHSRNGQKSRILNIGLRYYISISWCCHDFIVVIIYNVSGKNTIYTKAISVLLTNNRASFTGNIHRIFIKNRNIDLFIETCYHKRRWEFSQNYDVILFIIIVIIYAKDHI